MINVTIPCDAEHRCNEGQNDEELADVEDNESVASFDSNNSDTWTYDQFMAHMLGEADWRTASGHDKNGVELPEDVRVIMKARRLTDEGLNYEQKVARAMKINIDNCARDQRELPEQY